jgi:hypothetical protein
MDDLRKLGEPLTAHWGKFGNDAPNSSPYSTGICAVIEAVQHYMGQVPAPIKSKFLVYLRGAGVSKNLFFIRKILTFAYCAVE